MLRRLLLALLILGTSQALAQSPTEPDCTADVTLHEALTADVTYRCRSNQPLSFVAESERVQPFLGDFVAGRVESSNGLVTTRYRFDLGGYARATNVPADGIQRGRGVLLPLGAWLLEPRGYLRLPVIDLRVRTPDGMAFTSGLPRSGDAWRLAGATVRFAGFSAFGRFEQHEIVVPAPGSLRTGQPRNEAVLRLALLDGFTPGARQAIVDWVERTALATANYFDGFTAADMLLALVPMPRSGVGFGRTQSAGGVTVMVEVGESIDARRLFDDWVLVHELVHTGMPFVRGRNNWLMEGAATYAEPIIRTRAGWKSEEAVWAEWLRDMPQGAGVFARGLPAASGRENYWGGAISMLLADLAIRRASDGTKGLEDCLAGALAQGFDGASRTSLDAYVQACDGATGTQAMSALVDRHVNANTPVDLGALWREIGVALVDGRIVFDDGAPQARWRRMIVLGPPGQAARPIKLPWKL